jgi:RNA polymerase sigma factor (sigma-70 family)
MDDVTMTAVPHSADNKKSNTTRQGVLDEHASLLVVNHMEIGKKLAWKLLRSWNIRLPEDDVTSITSIALCEAAKNYDGRESTQFQTFLYYHLRGRLLREISDIVAYNKFSYEYSHEEQSDAIVAQNESSAWYETSKYNAENPEKIIVEKEQQASFDKAFAELDWLEKEVITRHYFNGESLMELADALQYCRCHLSRVKSKAIAQLHKAVDSHDLPTDHTDSAIKRTVSYKGGRGRRKDGSREIRKKIIPAKKVTAMVLEAAQA